MPATHKGSVYKPIKASNPFHDDGDKAFADLLQNQINETKKWRSVAMLSLLSLIINFCMFIYAVRQQKTVPVLINVMPSGESQYLGEVRQNGEVQIPEAAILYQIRKFIANLRNVSTDYQVLYNNIDECFAMVTSSYSPVLSQQLRNSNPFDLVGQIRRTVEIESVLNITARSYQINWTETVLESSSSPKTARMRAVITVRLLPATDASIKKNPLGIYIENCEMAEL
jgi:type IV secretion system protein VirB5